MRILLIGIGTRGDVQPLLALGTGLKAAGYDVVLAAGTNFQEMIESAGLGYEPIRIDIQELMNSKVGKEWIEQSSKNPIRGIQHMRIMLESTPLDMGDELLRISEGADVMVSGILSFGITETIARTFGKTHMTHMLTPLNPSRYAHTNPSPVIPFRRNFLNKLTSQFAQYLMYWIMRDTVKRLRQKLGQPSMSFRDYTRAQNHDVPVLYGLSGQVVPRPDDWDDNIHVTGYWFYDVQNDWQPPSDLADFLAGGPAPVYIGFGSMADPDPANTVKIMVEALSRTGQRGIIHSGWAGLQADDLPAEVFLLGSAPHDWLFPRMAAVIHHGGAGTTAVALRAGVPNSIVTHIGDQPYWGRRVAELGVGTGPVARHKLNSDNLTDMIQQLTSRPEIRSKAASLSEKIRAEDGVSAAVRVFDRVLGKN